MADPFGKFEPGQDDLIKDDNVKRSLARKAKEIPKTITGEADDIYTDHNAGSRDEFTPTAERDRGPARRSGGDPVAPSAAGYLLEKVKELFRRK